MRSRIVLLCLVLSLATLSCRTAQPAPPWTDEDRNDLRQMLSGSRRGEPTPLDFSNPVHYRFYRKQLEIAGITPAKYPQQFVVLNAARRQHIASGPPRPRRVTLAEANAVGASAVGPIQTITSFGPNGTTYGATGLSSVPDNSYVSQLTVGLYDPNMNVIGTPSFTQQYHAGEDVEGATSGTTTSGTVVSAVLTYFWQDQNGTPYHGYIQAASALDPTNITNTAPMPGTGQTVTKLCLGRTGSDCTYTPSGGSGSNVLMPVAGSITFSSAISTSPITPNTSLITMAQPDAGDGGGCTIASTTDFFASSGTTISGSTITWNLAPAQFQPANGCLTPNSQAIYTFTVGLTVGNLPVYVSITNDPDAPANNPYFLSIPDLYVYFSCLAAGTRVAMAGGGERPIETLKAGDSVITNTAGRALAIDSTLTGTETIPMVRLRTEAGHDLLLTEGHPVVITGGVTLARLLNTGDTVVTRNGSSRLTSVSREMFGGSVWNLNVGPRQEDFAHLANDTVFFANGILVGDNQMQFAHNRIHKHTPQSVLASLPPEWHRDYRNYTATAAARKDNDHGNR